MTAPASEETIQGSADWLQARCGFLGASSFADVLAKGQGITRKKCLRRIVAERLTCKPMETYSNSHMERGNEQEPLARAAYEEASGNLVDRVGFIRHPMLYCGFSPDGLISDEGGCEIKSVIPTVQIETILQGGYPSEHKAQIQGSLWVDGERAKVEGRKPRQWWDFCSFSPDLPDNLRLYVFRVVRDEAYIAALQSEVIGFLLECKELEDKLRGMK